jgi:hypothetical protein
MLGFFTKYREFLRNKADFESRIAQLETRNAALRRDLAELDEFTHRIARKRYQETYIPPETAGGTGEQSNVVPRADVSEVDRVHSAKRAIWAKVKGLKTG